MTRRTWIKLYCDKWLRGSLRKEGPELRGIWADLLAMAGDNSFGEEGTIELAQGVGFTDETIAGVLNVPVKLWRSVKGRLVDHPEPGETRLEVYFLGQGYGLRVLNWSRYQSEYNRQKPYRLKSPLHPPSEEKEEERRERGDSEGAVTEVTGEVTEKVTDALPPIPKQAPFDIKDKLKNLRHIINEKSRHLEDPDYQQRCQITPEWLRKDIEKRTREYVELVNDYAD
jgi:hypothetical protein